MVPNVARTLGNTEGPFARILRDLRFTSTRPVVRNIRAAVDIICEVPAKRPHWRPLCLSKKRVSSNVTLLNPLQFTRDLMQHTRPGVRALCDENIDYRICRMMYGETQQTGMSAYFCCPTLYYTASGTHTYFVLRKTLRSFSPIVTFCCKGLLHSDETVPCSPKLITMVITIGVPLLGVGPHVRRFNRKCHALWLVRLADRRN